MTIVASKAFGRAENTVDAQPGAAELHVACLASSWTRASSTLRAPMGPLATDTLAWLSWDSSLGGSESRRSCTASSWVALLGDPPEVEERGREQGAPRARKAPKTRHQGRQTQKRPGAGPQRPRKALRNPTRPKRGPKEGTKRMPQESAPRECPNEGLGPPKRTQACHKRPRRARKNLDPPNKPQEAPSIGPS